MIDATLIPWILAGIPLLGAALSPALWAHPHRLMAWSVGILVPVFALVTLIFFR